MGQTITTTYTCDVCGAAVNVSQVISYNIGLAMTGNGQPSQPSQQSYACQLAGHAAQAAQNLLNALEAQRTQPA